MKKVFLTGLLALALFSPSKGRAVDWFLTVSAASKTENAPTGAALMLGQDANGSLRAVQVNKNGTFVSASSTVATVTSTFAMNPVTYASSVQGTSMAGLTITSASTLTLMNNGTKQLNFILTNSSTAPTNTATVFLSLQPAQTWVLFGLSIQDTVLHWFNASAETVTNTAVLRY